MDCERNMNECNNLLLLLFTAIGFSPGGSSPYTSTHNTNGHIRYTYTYYVDIGIWRSFVQ
jgi:hypothetical protein